MLLRVLVPFCSGRKRVTTAVPNPKKGILPRNGRFEVNINHGGGQVSYTSVFTASDWQHTYTSSMLHFLVVAWAC